MVNRLPLEMKGYQREGLRMTELCKLGDCRTQDSYEQVRQVMGGSGI